MFCFNLPPTPVPGSRVQCTGSYLKSIVPTQTYTPTRTRIAAQQVLIFKKQIYLRYYVTTTMIQLKNISEKSKTVEFVGTHNWKTRMLEHVAYFNYLVVKTKIFNYNICTWGRQRYFKWPTYNGSKDVIFTMETDEWCSNVKYFCTLYK